MITISSKLLAEERKTQWDTVRKIVDTTTDKLGKPIDEEIKELIVGLNSFGFRTTMSCIGHIRENKMLATEEFVLTPYVFIKPILDQESEKMLEYLRRKVSETKEGDKKEDYRKAYKDWVSFRDKVSAPYYMCIKQLIDFFAEFYKTRQVTYDAQVVVSGSLQRVTLRSMGEKYIYTLGGVNQKTKLKEYQDEFIAFGGFLKRKYLTGGETPFFH